MAPCTNDQRYYYTEPDVVVNFGNVCEMIFWFQTYTPDKDQIHSEISYSNMTHRSWSDFLGAFKCLEHWNLMNIQHTGLINAISNMPTMHNMIHSSDTVLVLTDISKLLSRRR